MLEVEKQNLSSIAEKCQAIPSCWWDVFCEYSIHKNYSFKNNRFYSARQSEIKGYGIRININGNSGFSFCNDVTMIDSVLEYARETARYGEREEYLLPGPQEFSDVACYDEKILQRDNEYYIHALQSVIDRIHREYNDCMVDAGFGCIDGYVHLINSQGFDKGYHFSRNGTTISALRILPDGSRVQIYETMTWNSDFNIDAIVERILWKLAFSQKTVSMPFGNYFVIFTPKAFGQIMSVVLQGLSGRAIERGISRYIGKFGQKIFGKNLTVYDNPLIDFAPSSYPFDDEGIPAHNKTLIENGCIKTYIAHLQSAHLLNTPPTGNASRSYATLPTESFSNIVVEPGTMSFKDMITQMGTGIIIDQFIGFGQSNTFMGQFSANLDLAWLVVQGSVKGRLKNSMVSDDVTTMLNDKIVLSAEREWVGNAYLPYVLCRINYSTN
ncbi:MAG: TldD/PmbA family protein [Spirochaetes bacterium]|nr:TldD/PmbA family protein [Spirochaetota bacterium]